MLALAVGGLEGQVATRLGRRGVNGRVMCELSRHCELFDCGRCVVWLDSSIALNSSSSTHHTYVISTSYLTIVHPLCRHRGGRRHLFLVYVSQQTDSKAFLVVFS
eukprot:COSAG05_NODE_692_length_7897_cov_3.572454_2_plen_105_part_00